MTSKEVNVGAIGYKEYVNARMQYIREGYEEIMPEVTKEDKYEALRHCGDGRILAGITLERAIQLSEAASIEMIDRVFTFLDARVKQRRAVAA